MIEIFFRGSAFIEFLMVILLCASVVSAQKSARKLVFADEFNGASGSPVDSSKWTMQTGGNGWGNKELQYYTDSRENTYLDGKGHLIIKTIKQNLPLSDKCWYGQCKYTSARLMTKNKFDQKYGRFEARIKIPRGIGMWPAFWMLGNDIDKMHWPQCGEIDIMENIGREPSIVHGTIHGPGYSGSNGVGAPFNLVKNKAFADEFHIYSTVWSENQISFYVDEHLYKTITPKDLPAGKQWVYDHPFFMILNLAVGGNWPGPPDDTTIFPQTMIVDYVRVYNQ